jgi:hypothetical protein
MARHHGLSLGSDKYSVTATFWYGDEPRTVVGRNRPECVEEAVRRWGPGWAGEPVFSTPTTILNDLTGKTKTRHGTKYASGERHLRGHASS